MSTDRKLMRVSEYTTTDPFFYQLIQTFLFTDKMKISSETKIFKNEKKTKQKKRKNLYAFVQIDFYQNKKEFQISNNLTTRIIMETPTTKKYN